MRVLIGLTVIIAVTTAQCKYTLPFRGVIVKMILLKKCILIFLLNIEFLVVSL
mgnify:CR=1 FL=1